MCLFKTFYYFYFNLALIQYYPDVLLYCNELIQHPMINSNDKELGQQHILKVKFLLCSSVFCVYKYMHTVKIYHPLLAKNKKYLNYHFGMTVRGIVLINSFQKCIILHFPFTKTQFICLKGI